MLFFRAAARLFFTNKTIGQASWGQGEPMGSWRAPGEPMTPEASHSPNLRARLSSLREKKSSRPLNKAQAFFLRQVAKTNETMRAYFIHPLRCDEIIFWNLRVLRPVQFIFLPLYILPALDVYSVMKSIVRTLSYLGVTPKVDPMIPMTTHNLVRANGGAV